MQARLALEDWRRDYNHVRPHSRIGWLARSTPQTSDRNRAKGVRSAMAPRLAPTGQNGDCQPLPLGGRRKLAARRWSSSLGRVSVATSDD